MIKYLDTCNKNRMEKCLNILYRRLVNTGQQNASDQYDQYFSGE